MSEFFIFINEMHGGSDVNFRNPATGLCCGVTVDHIRFRVTDTQAKLIKEFHFPVSCYTPTGAIVCSSSNDLICFYITDEYPYLCNPSTERILRLPEVSFCEYFDRPSCRNLGFGYLPSSNEYKVVHLFYTKAHGSCFDIRSEVYSLSADSQNGAGSWRTIERKCPHPTTGFAVCVDQVLHWMPNNEVFDSRKKCYSLFEAEAAIISFDLKIEEFKTMPATPHWKGIIHEKGGTNGGLCELGGKLVLFAPTEVGKNAEMNIGAWMVKDYELGIWENAYTINLAYWENVIGQLQLPLEKLEIVPFGSVGEDKLMMKILIRIGINEVISRIACYNIGIKSFRKIEVSKGFADLGLLKKSVV